MSQVSLTSTRVRYCEWTISKTASMSTLAMARVVHDFSFPVICFIASIVTFQSRVEAQALRRADVIKMQVQSDRFIATFIRERQETISVLVSVVDDNKADQRTRIAAVTMLGEMRASEAVGILLEHLDVIHSHSIDEKTITSVFPCVRSLTKIGKPAALIVRKELRKPMTKLRRMALVAVIAGVEGRKVGKLLLEDDIRKLQNSIVEVDPEAVKNLRASLKTFLALTANERDFSEEPEQEQTSSRR